MDTYEALRPLYEPRSIAIIGASNNVRKFGGRPISYMGLTGYQGKIFPVHPRDAEVQGHKAYRDVRDIDEPVDLAMIAVPAAGCLDAARACVEAGVPAAVIIASGFAESDPEKGAEWQAELSAIGASGAMRIVGPNCMGTANFALGAVTTFATLFEFRTLRPGGIAMASQSGAIGAHALILAADRGLGVHSMVTTGNECDIDVAECIAYLAEDPTAKVISCYFEGCKRPEVLRAALERARENGKPVIALKVGETDIGAEAAGTHTASLAGSDEVFDAVLRMHGAHRAKSLDELLQVSAACAAGKFPKGRNLGIVTVSGGGGVMAADAAVKSGLEVPALPQASQDKLKALMPFAAVRNPVDTTAQVSNDLTLLDANLEEILTEGGCDAVVIFLTYVGLVPRIYTDIERILIEFRSRHPDALVVCTGLYNPEDAATLREHGYLVIEDLSLAVEMVAALEGFARSFRDAGARNDTELPSPTVTIPVGGLNEQQAMAVLGAAGIPVVTASVAATADEAVAAAAAISGPVVMKLLSADVAHKSDIGGVQLNLAGDAQVREAFDLIQANVAREAPEASVDGVLVAPMIKPGVETILGVVIDPIFGPALMLGLGGVFTEILEDVAIRPVPIDLATAGEMIGELRGKALLEGARGSEPADTDALAKAMVSLSNFAHHHRELIGGIDINPFVVLPKGEGAVALDALIVPADGSN